ncbi:DNA primase [Candidatus Kaiserbacteria bacterium]|nr:DNA primase [Candidatus Kaiserbacteria bacterium]
MTTNANTVQQVKDRLSIVDVVSGYVKLDRAGGALRARCPFHAEKSPSFFVSPERGTYHCFGCNVGGDIFSFVQAIEGVDFKGALKMLADRAGVPLDFARGREIGGKDIKDRLFEVMEAATIYYVSKLTDEALAYLKNRGLEDTTIRSFRLGYAGAQWSELSDHLKAKKFTEAEIVEAGLAKKNDRGSLTDKFRNRIMFPINDTTGRVVAFSGRIFGSDASPEAPKYLNSPETPLFHKSRILYGFDRAKIAMRKVDCAVLVEGQMDLIMSHQAGWNNTVAVSGTAFTADHARIIKRMTDNLVLALDADQAGIKAAGRAAREALALGLNVKVARIAEGKDPADLIKAQGADVWRATIREAKDIITFLLDVLHEHASQPSSAQGSGMAQPSSAQGSGRAQQDKFRRLVEQVVLPFLADVQSPIAREQYTREIAARLGVSETSVVSAAAKIPVAPHDRAAAEPVPAVHHKQDTDRALQAFALLLWQESLPTPAIDSATFRRELAEILGSDTFAMLEALDEKAKEAMRFDAEHKHGKSLGLAAEAAMLVRLILQERLAAEIKRVSILQDRAAEMGDTAEEERLAAQIRVLTTQLAKSHI